MTTPIQKAIILKRDFGFDGAISYADQIGQNNTQGGAEYREAASILRKMKGKEE